MKLVRKKLLFYELDLEFIKEAVRTVIFRKEYANAPSELLQAIKDNTAELDMFQDESTGKWNYVFNLDGEIEDETVFPKGNK